MIKGDFHVVEYLGRYLYGAVVEYLGRYLYGIVVKYGTGTVHK